MVLYRFITDIDLSDYLETSLYGYKIKDFLTIKSDGFNGYLYELYSNDSMIETKKSFMELLNRLGYNNKISILDKKYLYKYNIVINQSNHILEHRKKK